MELKEIPMGSVRPDPNNPRSDFGDIKALAKTFDLTPGNPGEPINPPVMVADGDVYRIVDGERRYRAMKLSKRTTCHAIVCEDFAEADSLVAMLATDDKAPLTDAERLRGVQQMLLLGVPERQIETAARLQKGQAKKIRTAVEIVGEKDSGQYSLDWLLAIEDFKKAGANDEELAIVVNACASEWKNKIDMAIDRFENRQKREALLEYFDDADLRIVDLNAVPEGYSYATMITSVDQARDYVKSGRNIGDVLVYCSATNSVDVYRERSSDAHGADQVQTEAQKKEDDLRKKKDTFCADIDAGIARRFKWYAKCLMPAGSKGDARSHETPVLDRLIERFALENDDLGSYYDNFIDIAEVEPADIALSGSRVLIGKVAAPLYGCASVYAELNIFHCDVIDRIFFDEELDADSTWDLERFSEWMCAHEISGYAFDEADKRVMAIVNEKLGIQGNGASEDTAAYADAPAAADAAEEAAPEISDAAPEVILPLDPMTDASAADPDEGMLDIGSMTFSESPFALA